MTDEIVEYAKRNKGCLFVLGINSEKRIREIEGSGPVGVVLLENHPHFRNVPGTRKYVLEEFYRDDLDGCPVGDPDQSRP